MERRARMKDAQAFLLNRLKKRARNMQHAWCFGDYVICKSGSEVKLVRRKKGHKIGKKEEADYINISLGEEVWLEDIYTTGVRNIV